MTKRKTLSIALAGFVAATPAFANGQVNLLAWEGYADPSFITKFEQESGCKVNATYVGSGEEIIAKVAAGGGAYDLIAPASDITKIFIDAGFVEPLDTSKITEWNNIFPQFRDLDNIQKDGEHYAMPYAWGAISFMYRTSAFSTPPTSLKELFDEKHAGRVSLWDDKSAIYVGARANGDMNIYDLSDEQLEAAKATLIRQKPLIRKYWTSAGELTDLYVNNEIDISNTWAGYVSEGIKAQGVEVTEFVPQEGVEGWLDSWMVLKGHGTNECTYKFLNMQSGELGQCGIIRVMNYSVVNPVAARTCTTEEKFKALHMDDPSYIGNLLLWQPLGERLEVYTNAWNAVKAN